LDASSAGNQQVAAFLFVPDFHIIKAMGSRVLFSIDVAA
jgi:hypothetical protein